MLCGHLLHISLYACVLLASYIVDYAGFFNVGMNVKPGKSWKVNVISKFMKISL